MANHYTTLGVAIEAEDVVIEGAYRALMKRYHPDVFRGDPSVAEARAKAINAAYAVLRDPAARARYDRTLGHASSGVGSKRSRPPPDPDPDPDPDPEPTPDPAPKDFTAGDARPSHLTSNLFIALAAVILVGALGSIGNSGTAAPSAVDAQPTDGAQPASSTAIGASAQPTRRSPALAAAAEPAPSVSAVAADEPADPSGSDGRPSFDCSRADNDVTRLICRNGELGRADAALAARYQRVLRSVDAPTGVRDEQRRWLAERDRAPADPEVLLRLYRERMATLGGDSDGEPIY